MTPTEAQALVAYANQLDPRVQANPATMDMWAAALVRVPHDVGQWVVRDYYANALTEGQPPTITPQVIRRLSSAARDEIKARESASKALPPGARPESFGSLQARGRRSEAFRRAFDQARIDRADRLASRGIDPTPHHLSPAEVKEWERVTGRRSSR